MYKQVRGTPVKLWRHWSYMSTKQISPTFLPVAGSQTQPAATAYWQFRANSIYDPDEQTGGQVMVGQQDTLAHWDHYVVYYTRMTVWFYPWSTQQAALSLTTSNNNLVPIWFGLHLHHDAAYQTGVPVMILQGDKTTDYKICPMGHITSQHNNPSFKLQLWFNAKSFFAVKDPMDAADLGAIPNANPVEMAHFQVYSAALVPPPTGANDYGTWQCTIQMDSWGFCQEPRTVGPLP